MRRPLIISLLLLAASVYGQYVGGIGGGGTTNCSAAFAMLPVELLEFSARPEGEQVMLQWTTATELNNAGFHVERSRDGEHYDAILQVEGMGTTVIVTHYEAVDRAPLHGLSYYRLRQTDIDGTMTWSPAVAVEFTAACIAAFPNPVRDVLMIQGGSTEGARHVELFDSRGRAVLQAALPEGVIQLDMAALPGGLYRVRVSCAQGAETLSVVKE